MDTAVPRYHTNYHTSTAYHNKYCADVLAAIKNDAYDSNFSVTTQKSQVWQDAFIWRNLFADRTAPGFFVDSGSAEGVIGSNSYFFEKCFGWRGLCVEPNERFHRKLRAHRKCTIVPECISNVSEIRTFYADGFVSGVTRNALQQPHANVSTIQCRPLPEMLQRARSSEADAVSDGTSTHPLTIDLWSLDVEGFELAVLSSIDFTQLSVCACKSWMTYNELSLPV